MKALIIDAEALGAVSPQALRSYIEFEGWRKAEPFGKFGFVYKSDQSGKVAELLVPFSHQLADYALAVGEIIKRLSDSEQRDQTVIYRDMVLADRDVIRVRSPEAGDDGSVEVQQGVELFQQARDLIASAACAATETRAAYHLGKVQKATDYMRKVRLGQTEQGSFVITMIAPVPPALSVTQQPLWPEFEEEPFERQVTRTLATSLQAAHDAVLAVNQGEGAVAFEAAVANGVSANLCEALSSIVESGHGAEISLTWARTRPAPQSRTRVIFDESAQDVLSEAARVLRSKEPRRDEHILGYVVTLNSEPTEADGRIRIKTLIDGKTRTLSAELSETDYRLAIEAHEKNAPVSIKGDIEATGRPWRLIQPRDMRIVSTSED